jgi:hypothetical protein
MIKRKEMINVINKKSNYLDLLNSIKNTKQDDSYKPRKYNFGLKDFNEKGEIKKESQSGSQNKHIGY